jgi:protein subunit release factor A
VQVSREFQAVSQELDETRSMLDGELGDEMRALVTREIAQLQGRETVV